MSVNENNIAKKVFEYLKKNKEKMLLKNTKISKKEVIKKLKFFGVRKIDYLKFLNITTLKSNETNKRKYNIFIAYYLGKVRLIDNL